MTFTADSGQNLSRSLSNYRTRKGDVVANSITAFKSLDVDEQLAVLWFAYIEMGHCITPVATGPARLELAAGLLNEIKVMSHQEQLQVVRDLVTQKNTQISRSYGVLSPNTKLAFWYELSELMQKEIIISIPSEYQLSQQAAKVLESLKEFDFSQQITFLRKAIADMGVDPFTE